MRYKIQQQKTEKGLTLCAIISDAEQALSIPVPSCSSWEQKFDNMFSFTLVLLSVWHRKNNENSIVFNSVSRHDDVILEYRDMMTKCRNVVVIGIRNNRTALRNKRLYNVISRVVASHPGKQGSRPGPSIFFLMGPFFYM